MLESARKSVDRLIEYEPERAQNTITILLSELVVYSLLLKIFEADALDRPGYNARAERLRLRKDDYSALAHAIYSRASLKRGRNSWKEAAALIGELNHRYHDAFDKWLDDPADSAFPVASRIPEHVD